MKKVPINRFSGTTMIEIMVAMILGMMVMGACLQFFLVIKQILQTQIGLSRIQENGRIANVLLGGPIQQAGNIGCNAFSNDISFIVHDGN